MRPSALLLLALTFTSPAFAAEPAKIDGFAIPAYGEGEFTSSAYRGALVRARNMGAEWVSLHATYFQDGVRGTEIFNENPARHGSTPGVEEQRQAVRQAHKEGLHVLLKPHVDLRSGEGWRGDIGLGMSAAEVEKWFENYTRLLLEHAKMAEEEKVEMLAVGTELTAMQDKESHWRALVAKIRAVYHGPLVFCANHDEEGKVLWWDTLDYIGVDAYYSLSSTKDPTPESLLAAWKPYLARCEALSKKFGKKVLFTEVGYMSREGTSIRPYDWEIPPVSDEAEQKDCYDSLFASAYAQDWCEGFFLWALTMEKPGKGDTDYTPEGKPAEAVVRHWFKAPEEVR